MTFLDDVHYGGAKPCPIKPDFLCLGVVGIQIVAGYPYLTDKETLLANPDARVGLLVVAQAFSRAANSFKYEGVWFVDSEGSIYDCVRESAHFEYDDAGSLFEPKTNGEWRRHHAPAVKAYRELSFDLREMLLYIPADSSAILQSTAAGILKAVAAFAKSENANGV